MNLTVNSDPEGDRLPVVVTVIRRQRGGSQSRLVLCDDDKLYVLKMHPNPQGPNVLANEAIGSTLIRGLGLPSPRWTPIKIDLKAVKFFPELAMVTATGGLQFPACGLHFGSELLGGPDHEVFDFIPAARLNTLKNSAHFLAIRLFDIWANHQDDRQCVFQRLHGEKMYETYFVDNGHLFGGPRWSELPGHSRRLRFSDAPPIVIGDPQIEFWLNRFEALIPRLLRAAVAQVPRAWYLHDIHLLYHRLLHRLETIRSLVEWEITRSRSNPRPAIGKNHNYGEETRV